MVLPRHALKANVSKITQALIPTHSIHATPRTAFPTRNKWYLMHDGFSIFPTLSEALEYIIRNWEVNNYWSLAGIADGHLLESVVALAAPGIWT
jgi:hypothetical protein